MSCGCNKVRTRHQHEIGATSTSPQGVAGINCFPPPAMSGRVVRAVSMVLAVDTFDGSVVRWTAQTVRVDNPSGDNGVNGEVGKTMGRGVVPIPGASVDAVGRYQSAVIPLDITLRGDELDAGNGGSGILITATGATLVGASIEWEGPEECAP